MQEATPQQRAEELQSLRRGEERIGLHNNAGFLEDEAIAQRIQRREERRQAMRDWQDMRAFPGPSRRGLARNGMVYRGGYPKGWNGYY